MNMGTGLTAKEFFGHDFPHPEWCSLSKDLPCMNGPSLLILDRVYGQSIGRKCKLIECPYYKEIK